MTPWEADLVYLIGSSERRLMIGISRREGHILTHLYLLLLAFHSASVSPMKARYVQTINVS